MCAFWNVCAARSAHCAHCASSPTMARRRVCTLHTFQYGLVHSADRAICLRIARFQSKESASPYKPVYFRLLNAVKRCRCSTAEQHSRGERERERELNSKFGYQAHIWPGMHLPASISSCASSPVRITAERRVLSIFDPIFLITQSVSGSIRTRSASFLFSICQLCGHQVTNSKIRIAFSRIVLIFFNHH